MHTQVVEFGILISLLSLYLLLVNEYFFLIIRCQNLDLWLIIFLIIVFHFFAAAKRKLKDAGITVVNARLAFINAFFKCTLQVIHTASLR